MKSLQAILLCVIASYSGILFSETIVIGGSGADLATFKLLSDKFKQHNPGIKIKILPSIGSGGGIRAAQNNKIDLCLTSRAPKTKEFSGNLIFNLYAQTPLVFSVNKELSIDNITTQDVLNIYSGTMTDWGNNLQVKPVLRPSNDSDTLLLVQHLPGFDKAIASAYKRRGLPVATTDQDAIELIQNLQGAIGSTTMSIIETVDSPVKALSLNGVAPISENIKNGSYRLFKSLYYCYKEKPSASLKSLLDFINSKEGKDILNRTGHYTGGVVQ